MTEPTDAGADPPAPRPERTELIAGVRVRVRRDERNQTFVLASDAAKILGMVTATVRGWCVSGKAPGRQWPGGKLGRWWVETWFVMERLAPLPATPRRKTTPP